MSLVIVPPLEEQRRIVHYLDKEVSVTCAPKSSIQAAVEVLNEYRSALISAAVTGKIDVRGQAARQPASAVPTPCAGQYNLM